MSTHVERTKDSSPYPCRNTYIFISFVQRMYIFCRIPAFQVTTMAFLPGLKKQINKANQFMSEKISGVEGTKERSQPVNL